MTAESTIKGYRASIYWRAGERELSFLTVDERNDLIGHPGIASATYTPLVPCATGAVAWLVEGISPGPFLTPDERAAWSYVEQGATAWGLGLAQ